MSSLRRFAYHLTLAGSIAAGACGQDSARAATALTGGDPAQAPQLIQHYGCGSCHVIPGIRGARGAVGPPLRGFVDRTYIAGRVEHTPENLVRWIQNPPAFDPETAMPDLGVSADEARHIAAYLYTIR